MAEEIRPSASETRSSSLPRVLGLWDIIAIIVGGVIGSGIFIVPKDIAAAVGSPLLMMAVWVVGGLLSFFGALTFAEMGAAYPQAGGMYVFLREAYGKLPSFLFGWTLFLVIDTGALATLAVAFSSKYLPFFIPSLGDPAGGLTATVFGLKLLVTPSQAVAVALILFLAAVNILGTRWGANLQNLLTVVKFVALAGICVVVFLFAEGSTRNFLSPPSKPLSLDLISAFGLGLVAVMWAYKGWEQATFSAGETKHPERNIPLGLFAGTLVVIGIYIAANLAYLYVFPAPEIAASDRIASLVMNKAVGGLGAAIIAAIILFSITGAANQNLLCSPRVYYAMAKDGIFIPALSRVHGRFKTPHLSILSMSAWSVVLILFFGTFERLFTYVVFGQWLFFGLTAAAVFILRAKKPGLPRPYRTFGYPLIPAVFILSALFISLNSLVRRPQDALLGLGIIFLGLPVYFVFLFLRTKPRAEAQT
ncbi:MAG: amino acid permease [Candidatus Aminicenantes bacterium]|nr:amino acid permease [Candidatus Aminicenantes bacterium]